MFTHHATTLAHDVGMVDGSQSAGNKHFSVSEKSTNFHNKLNMTMHASCIQKMIIGTGTAIRGLFRRLTESDFVKNASDYHPCIGHLKFTSQT